MADLERSADGDSSGTSSEFTGTTTLELAEHIRNWIIGGSAPYWALDSGIDIFTADDVRREVNPVLTRIIHACSDVIGDGFYPTIEVTL